MSLSSESTQPESRALVEAAAWRLQLTEAGAANTPQFQTWLAQSELNSAAWAKVQEGWDFIGDHATSPEVLELRRGALGRAREASRRRWLTPGWHQHWHKFAAVGVVAVLIATALLWNFNKADVYSTQSGERRLVRLIDGSQIHLDSLSEVRVRYSRHARDLQLTQGQARFDVAHDVERPFSVRAGDQKVIATGTSFNVDLLGEDLFVTLIEGRVLVKPQEPASKPHAVVAQGVELNAGEQLAVFSNGATTRVPVNVERAVSWESGQLVFHDQRLSEVVERMNRYSPEPLVLENGAGDLRISGVFNTGDVDGFVDTLTRYLPLRAEERNGALHLRR